MKKLLLAIAFCPFIGFTQQQVPNGDFESWSKTVNCQSGDSLVGYTSFDETAPKILGCLNDISASTDAQSGIKAVKIVPLQLGNQTAPSTLFLGKGPKGESDGGIPFTHTPSKLKGYYKVTLGGTDALMIAVFLYKDSQKIGFGYFTTSSTVSTYTEFETTIAYSEATTPDSLALSILVGDIENKRGDKASIALVDNFTFEYGTITSNYKTLNPLKLFYTTIDDELKFSETVSEITIYDNHGKSQATYSVSTSSVPLNNLNNGMYLVTYKYKNNYYSSKFIIE